MKTSFELVSSNMHCNATCVMVTS